ncbi:hypothetical protein [Planctomicrobium piriforme]|uniref:Zinc-finger n=1 Tax=Planctomicrobium piriforme TaxID=1576369 RepID=A0A1I3DAB9_9PLAN|nr:hypothetical protein [Planctomicrobium piriforme]SFH83680.1 hypothetical protein SAMN05421753_103155 [Planctomicrobium piriforme]
MKRISCDDAFHLITDPHASQHGELQAHLQDCPRCRDLADALSPLLSSLTTPAPESPRTFSMTLPAGEPAVQIAHESAERLNSWMAPRKASASYRAGRWTWKILSASRYAAVFVGGVAAALGFAALQPSSPAAASPADRNVCVWSTRQVAESHGSADVVLTCVACHLNTARH